MVLNSKQKEAVSYSEGNLLVTASPGAGKTKTLVSRAAFHLEKLHKNKSIALVTYTNNGADEIASRLPYDNRIFIGTIHGFCLEFILRPFCWVNKWVRPKVISHDLQELFFEENTDINLESEFGKNKFDELNKVQKHLNGELNTDLDWGHDISLTELATRYYKFQEEKKVIDFNEILFRSYVLISENDFIAESVSLKFAEILVDEFQDTNSFQYEILKRINESGECSFFFVGDRKQMIFSFAGAIDGAFEKALLDFNATEKELTEIYRSTDNIVNTYSKLFNDHPILTNQSGNKCLDIKVKISETQKENHLNKVVTLVDYLVNKKQIDPSEIAILSTSWFQCYEISKALRTKYNIVGLGALPHRYINNSTVKLLQALSKYYIESNIRNLRLIKRTIDIYILENDLNLSEKELSSRTNTLISRYLKINIENNLERGLAEIKGFFDEVFLIPNRTFDDILSSIKDDDKRDWNIKKYIETISGVGGITSNTIHKVKGMEFEAVILNNMNENKIPYQKCISQNPWTYQKLTPANIEEGRKLFYVAMSRAKTYLCVFHNWKPSMFINVIK